MHHGTGYVCARVCVRVNTCIYTICVCVCVYVCFRVFVCIYVYVYSCFFSLNTCVRVWNLLLYFFLLSTHPHPHTYTFHIHYRLQQGHYTSFCYNAVTDAWEHFNDSRVAVVTEEEVHILHTHHTHYSHTHAHHTAHLKSTFKTWTDTHTLTLTLTGLKLWSVYSTVWATHSRNGNAFFLINMAITTSTTVTTNFPSQTEYLYILSLRFTRFLITFQSETKELRMIIPFCILLLPLSSFVCIEKQSFVEEHRYFFAKFFLWSRLFNCHHALVSHPIHQSRFFPKHYGFPSAFLLSLCIQRIFISLGFHTRTPSSVGFCLQCVLTFIFTSISELSFRILINNFSFFIFFSPCQFPSKESLFSNKKQLQIFLISFPPVFFLLSNFE